VYKEYGAKRKWGGTHFFVWDKSEHFFTFVSKKNQKKEDGIFLYSEGLKWVGAVGFLLFLLLFISRLSCVRGVR